MLLPALFGLVAFRVASFAILDIRGRESSAIDPLWVLQEERMKSLSFALATPWTLGGVGGMTLPPQMISISVL